MVGKYCVVRPSMDGGGVFAGVVTGVDGNNVFLADARRLYYWRVPLGAPAFLSGVASHGLDPNESKIGEPNDMTLRGWSEIILCSAEAERSIRSVPSHLRVS